MAQVNKVQRSQRVRRARAVEAAMKVVTGAIAFGVMGVALFILGYILYRGASTIDWTFLTEFPTRNPRKPYGIMPAIVGTLYLTLGTALFAVPVGVLAGVYLSEYAPRGRRTRIIRLSIANMAGVPSIVYGLFGLALFVITFQFRPSILAGSLTLACMTLPVIITATEEALRQIPQELRQGSLALGATRLRTIWKIVLPAAAPGIVTGCILGLSRAAGETAPILLTAVAAKMGRLPDSPLDKAMALPYHLYYTATQVPNPKAGHIWGTALVLVAGVSILQLAAAAWRSARRRKVRW